MRRIEIESVSCGGSVERFFSIAFRGEFFLGAVTLHRLYWDFAMK